MLKNKLIIFIIMIIALLSISAASAQDLADLNDTSVDELAIDQTSANDVICLQEDTISSDNLEASNPEVSNTENVTESTFNEDDSNIDEFVSSDNALEEVYSDDAVSMGKVNTLGAVDDDLNSNFNIADVDYSGEIRSSNDLVIGSIDYSGEIKNVVGTPADRDVLGSSNSAYGLTFKIDPDSINYGETAVLTITGTTTGQIKYKVGTTNGGGDVVAENTVGNKVVVTKSLNLKSTVGTHTIYVVAATVQGGFSKEFSLTYTVNQITPVISTSITGDIPCGEYEKVQATISPSIVGNVKFELNTGESYTVTINAGETATAGFNNLKQGEYTLTTTFAPTDTTNYKTVSKKETFKVNAIDPQMNLTYPSVIDVNKNATITAQLPVDAEGTVTFTVGTKTYDSVNVENGIATITTSNFTTLNTYDITAKYDSTCKYEDDEETGSIVVRDAIYVNYDKGTDGDSYGSSWENPVKTIKYAVERANSIASGQCVIYLAGVTHNVTVGMDITRTVSIVGQKGTVVTNYGTNAGIFTITAADVEIINCTFANNTPGLAVDVVGDVIMSKGNNLMVNNCTFINNTAGSGAAIYNSGDNCIINNSHFIGNKVTGGGAAIYNSGANFVVGNSSFINNTAMSSGGAIHSSAGGFIVGNSTFINNNGTGGGAINIHNPSSTIAISGGMVDNCTFINNTATSSSGGAILNYANTFKVNNSRFTNNTANNDGGAIVNYANHLNVNNTYFINNNATSKGGAISDEYTGLNVYNSHFINNTATNGTIYTSYSVMIVNNSFINNTVDKGVAIYNVFLTSSAQGTGLSLINNTYSGISGDKTYIYNTNMIITPVTITVLGNRTVTVGPDDEVTLFATITTEDGASVSGYSINFYVDGSSTPTISPANDGHVNYTCNYANPGLGKHSVSAKYIRANNAANAVENGILNVEVPKDYYVDYVNGNDENTGRDWEHAYKTISHAVDVAFDGVIIHLADGTHEVTGQIDIDKNNITLVGNTTKALITNNKTGVGVFKISADNISIYNCTFANNTATTEGGVIYNNGDHANFTIYNSYFINNTATNDGGVIYNSNGVNFTIYNSTFINNTANGTAISGGGAIRNTGSGFTIYNSTFINNTAVYGGAIDNYGGVNFTVYNSNFTDNTASNFGGAIDNNAANFTVYNSNFASNNASNGGAIRNEGYGLTISNSSFTNNRAVNGGAIYNSETGSNAIIKNSTFIGNNVTERGGAIKNLATGVSVINSTFEDNIGVEDSGAIGNDGANLLITNSSFVNNTAKISGAIRNTGINLRIVNSNFTKNHASVNDGVIGIDAANSTILNSNFNDNYASGNGGAITVSFNKNYNASIINSTFVGNRANNGGAIYNPTCNLTVINSTFTSNSATNGGAVYVGSTAKLNVSGSSKFESNEVTDKGGAIFNIGNVSVANSTFVKNSASSHGGAISSRSAKGFSVVNSTFESNTAIWGGAINIQGTDYASIDDCIFTENIAKSYKGHPCAGAVDIDGSKNVFIKDSTFKNNVLGTDNWGNAQGGSSIFSSGFNLTVYNCTFDGDKAHIKGIIYSNADNLNVINSSFTNNSAQTGEAIYSLGKNLRVENSTFTKNYGGTEVIFNKGTDAVIKNSTFEKNTATLATINNGENAKLLIQNSTFKDNNIDNIGGKGVAVYNQKNAYLNLENNTYTGISDGKTYIYNEGTLAQVNITVLENKTVDVYYNQVISLSANITSDGASVYGQKIYFTLNTTDDKYQATNYMGGLYSTSYTVKHVGNATVGAIYTYADNGDKSASDVINVATARLNSDRGYTDLNVIVKNISVGDEEVIKIYLNSDAEGNVTLTLNDTNKYNVTQLINKGTVTFAISDLPVGNYSVNVTYHGSSLYYNKTNNTATFKVSKLDPDFRADIVNITYGSNATIIINLPTNINGKELVNLTINGTSHLIDIVNGKGELVLENLSVGTYDVVANFTGNDNYTSKTIKTGFKVDQYTAALDVVIDNVTYGQISTITAILTSPNNIGLNGTVIVSINNGEYTREVKVTNGRGVLSDLKLPVNVYDFTATWNKDGSDNKNYTVSTDTGKFNVSKANIYIDVDALDIVYGKDTTVKVNLSQKVTGTVTVKIDGDSVTDISVTDGVGEGTYGGYKAGNHTVEVSFVDANGNYNSTSDKCNFTVSKANPTLDVTVPTENINFGDITQGVTIKVTGVDGNALDGSVNITIDGKSYKNEQTLTNGEVTITIGDRLTPGKHNISVTYNGDDNYNSIRVDDKSINVVKETPKLEVNIDSVDYNKTFTIEVTGLTGVNENLNGIVVFMINGTSYAVNVTDGKGSTTGIKLPAGEYSYNATWEGNENYTGIVIGNDKTLSFTVTPIKAPTVITTKDIVYGDNESITVRLPSDAKGNLTITVLDENNVEAYVKTASLVNGMVTFIVPNLNANKDGKYSVKLTYADDNNYNDLKYESNEFSVARANSTLNVDIIDVDYRQTSNITVTLDGVNGEKLAGIVYITIYENGNPLKDVKITVENGIAYLNTTELSAGSYTFTASATPDSSNYNNSKTEGSFVVRQSTPEFDITTSVIVYGENETITVKLPTDTTGYVNLTVDGKYYTTIDLKEGVGSVNVTKLSAGLHYFVFNYSGDSKYNEVSAMRYINVSKANPTLNVDIADIKYNNIFKITATLDGVYNEKLNGIVIVTVDGKKYYVEITDGEGYLDGIKLPVSNYEFSATWAGNSNYNNTTFTSSFNIAKINATVDISKSNITFGENETITVKLPSDITGSVTIKVDDDYYTVAIIDGVATKVLTGLNAGNHTLDITYDGDNNYDKFSNSSKFNVAKVDPVLDVTIDSVYCDEPAIITAILTGVNGVGLTGDVIITINNTHYTVSVVNGKVVSRQLLLGAGEYNFTAFWSGNNNYNNITTKGNFTVSKITPDITLLVNDVLFGYDVSLNTILSEGATGNITIEVDGEYYNNLTLDGRFANELIKGLDAGKHNITVTYNGDEKYATGFVTKMVNVFNANPGLNVVISNVKYGEIFTIDAFLTGANATNLNGNVTVIVNNVLYTVEVNDGKGSLAGVKLDKGTYNFTAYYAGAKNYNAAKDNGSFVVSEVTKGMYINVEDINVGEDAVITVTLPEDATNNVSITVNGTTYSVEVIKGTATKVISGLGAKYYVVEAYYPGDNNYEPMTAQDSFTVSKIDTLLDIVTNNIVFGENELITINLPNDATGTIVLIVNKEKYELTLSNGRASKVISGLNASNFYDVKVEYSGDDKYNPITDTSSFSVAKANPNFYVIIDDVNYGNASKIIATVGGINGSSLNGYVLVNINGTSHVVNVVNGIGKLNDLKLNVGEYNFTATWQENDNYNEAKVDGSFKVSKIDPVIDVSVADINVGEDAVIKVTASGNVTGNVTFTVGGQEHTLVFVNGVATTTISNLAADKYSFTLTYNGDNNYNVITKDVEFVVSKLDSGLNIDIGNVHFGENGTITAYLANGANGNVNITVAGKSYIVPIENGKATAVIDVLNAGNYSVVVKYDGNDKYAEDSVTGLLSVVKVNTFLNVNIDNVNYGDIFKITASLTGVNNTGLSGTVVVKVDGKDYLVHVKDGVGYLDGVKLNADKYEFSAYYQETQNYNTVSDSGVFNVFKVTPDINVEAADINVGEDTVITVTLPDDVTKNVTIKVNNQSYSVEVIKGTATKTISDLSADKYTVTVEYDGDDNYKYTSVTKTFDASKINPVIDITTNNIVFGENEIITINIPDATGKVILTVNSKEYNLTLSNGRATQVISGLNASSIYKVKVEYLGDDKYNTLSKESSFSVAKANLNLNVVISDNAYGEVSTIIATLGGVNGSSLTGYVLVNINGTSHVVNVVNGIGKLDDFKLNAGEYNFTATWQENSNYNESVFEGSFKVSKINPVINVSVADINVGEDAVIKVTASGNVTGNVTFTVDGQEHTLVFINGVATTTISNLAAGNYSFTLTYNGDNNYNVITKDVEFVVSKLDSELNIDIGNVRFGENGTITAYLANGASGNVNITVAGKSYIVPIENGVAKTNIDVLDAGNYSVTVKYDGNDKYAEDSVTGLLSVVKANPFLDVNIANVDYGEIFKITAVVNGVNNAGLTGTVVVKVDGKDYLVHVKDGVGYLDGVKLTADKYDFSAYYQETQNYNSVSDSGVFSVSKITPDISVEVADINVGENAVITVTLPDDVTKNVTIKVNNQNYSVEVIKGTATKTITDLSANKYTVTVEYDGDNNYNKNSAGDTFTVSKFTPVMDITTGNIVFGENEIITVNMHGATGNIILTVNNNEYNLTLSNGRATQVISGLNASSIYKVKVEYLGDDKYNTLSKESSFSVAKANVGFNVIINDVDYSEVSTIIATVTGINGSSLTGYVLVNINGTSHVVNVVNGIGKLDDFKLNAGSYNFTAVWQENSNYNEANVEGSFKVSKINPVINVIVEDINVGEDAVIKLTTSKDVTGNVTVNVGGQNYLAIFENGVANITIPNLKADEYSFNLNYNGDNNYISITETVEFVVSKINSDMNIGATNIVFGENATIFANLNNDTIGEVTITVDGVNYTAKIENGVASKDISGLNAGNHTVIVKYDGDDKYFENTLDTVFNVARANPTLNVNVADVKYGEIFEINAKLNGVSNAPLNGIVVVKVDGKEYFVQVKDGVGSIDGVKLPVSIYGFAASWEGNSNYENVNTEGSFDVAKAESTMDINVNPINVGENATITVKLPTDATGNVTASVNGINYTTEAKDGVATISIPDLKADNYNVTISYAGDDNYDPLVDYANFTVSKVSDYNASVIVPSEIKEGENTTIDMVLPTDATGNVTVTVDGKNYAGEVVNGVANVTIPPLTPGEHNITTSYSGDDKYDPVTKTTSVNVTKKEDTGVVLTLDDVVMYYHDGTRLIALLTDVNGNPIANKTVIFTVNGISYDRTTDVNGSASMALNLESGVYNVTATYDGNVSKASITVKSSIIGNDIIKMYQNGTQFYATFIGENGKPLANTNVSFNINGVFYKRSTDGNGIAKLTINLDPGNYTLTAINPFNNEQKGFNVLVRSLIETSDLTKYYLNGSAFVAKVYNKDGTLANNTNVTFNINGVFYTRTAINGTVRLNINLEAGNYTITSMYEGLSIGNKVSVLPTLETSDLSMKYGDGSSFSAKTLDGQGNPLANQNLTFNVNGVFYHKTTGDDGVAKLGINLMKGEYIITSYWNDFKTGNKIEIA